MPRTRTTHQLLDDETSPATDRVMRAYWLAPRTSKSATVIALLDSHARPTSTPKPEALRPR